ncbi:transposable element Tcb1 transposase [Trichonephila clavipes]|nr:transposable element Tcb1 transposase [Trichonephila clavipes]
MAICHHWMQEETTDRRGRSHSHRCTTARDYRRIVRMAVMDRAATSRTITQHSVSFRYFRRHLQQSEMSERRPLLRLPLTGNHRRLCRQWYDERQTWTTEWNDSVFTGESCFFLQHHDGLVRV